MGNGYSLVFLLLLFFSLFLLISFFIVLFILTYFINSDTQVGSGISAVSLVRRRPRSPFLPG